MLIVPASYGGVFQRGEVLDAVEARCAVNRDWRRKIGFQERVCAENGIS
jgi:hypothetical protein